jgi:hypothetical protein
MTKEEEEMMKLQYTYNDLMSAFLAGSTMLSNHHTSWREAFSKFMVTVLRHKKEDVKDVDLS